jgi:creatine kinase
MTGDLAGAYFPLAGSRSYAAMPGGMTEEKENSLRSRGNLFQEPDSTLLLSSGCGRHWPDARGIFHNNDENLFVWVNEEDQMRIVSMEKGDNVKRIIERFAKATSTIQTCLKAEGYDFMHSDHLGWILTCPSNLGTGLRAGAMVKVPLVSGRKDFKNLLGRMGLQARGTAGVDSASTGGTWDISNADRLGKSEIELVNIFIEGVAQIIRWEQALEKGENIEAEIAAAGLPKTVTIEVPFTSTRGMKL